MLCFMVGLNNECFFGPTEGSVVGLKNECYFGPTEGSLVGLKMSVVLAHRGFNCWPKE